MFENFNGTPLQTLLSLTMSKARHLTEIEQLREQLREAQETLEAIRHESGRRDGDHGRSHLYDPAQ